MIHELKILPQYLRSIKSGIKTYEVRRNDRDFQTNDVVHLYELKNGQTPIEPSFKYKISHIHYGLGMQEGYVVLGIYGI